MELFALNLGGDYNPSNMLWPTFMHDSQRTGCYDCDKIMSSRPQSKLSNLGNTNITGNLKILIQKENAGAWGDWNMQVYNAEVTIPASGLIKLDTGKDNLGNQVYPGFNNMNISVSQAGKYRVLVEFLGKSANWEFSVS